MTKGFFRKTLMSLTTIGALSPMVFMTSCGDVQAIQLANFESYMDEELMNDLQSKYNIHFPYYTVAEMIESKFQRYYDIAIPSGYEMLSLLRRGWLEEINWSDFDIGISSAEEAKQLFVPEIIDHINNQFTEYVFNTEAGSDLKQYFLPEGSVNVLKYGVPYFAQSFVFGYKGSPLTFYKYGTTEATSKPNWADIYYTISPSNPNCDERFAPSAGKRLGMVNDAKSAYDIARIAETRNEQPTNAIPEDDSKSRMLETFKTMTDPFKGSKSRFTLNSDSAVISKGLADPKGYAGAFTWSGDSIYAAKGAGEYPADPTNFHIQNVYGGSLDEVEFMVINKKNSKPEFEQKHKDIYQVVKQICLDGAQQSETEIVAFDDEHDRYKYWTMQNFDTINYTPMLANIYKAVSNKNSQYWQGESEEAINLYIQILSQPQRKDDDLVHLYGRTLTKLQNSNTHWAWLEASTDL